MVFLAAKEQKIIELALEHWQNVTCLNFIRRDDTPHGNRIVFTDVDGCASNVGRNPLGEPQFVSLASECLRVSLKIKLIVNFLQQLQRTILQE